MKLFALSGRPYLKNSFFALVVFSFLLVTAFAVNKYPDKLIWSDMEGYYMYLPSVFIYGGFNHEGIKDKDYLKPFPGTDRVFSKYTCGVAILEFPFFIMAHALSKPLYYKPDGHSNIYCYALMIAGAFYLWLGMILLWRVLTAYYPKTVTFFTLLALLAGTNLFYYSFFQSSMSHVYSFFLFSSVIYLTEKITVKNKSGALSKNYRQWYLLALCCGMIVLIRPTNIIFLLYPVYRILNAGLTGSSLKTFFTEYNRYILFSLLLFFIPFIPQLLYWKHVTNHWLIWSYGEEGFMYWKGPKLFRILFDAWNGWLLYSPLMILPIIYLVKERKKNTHNAQIILWVLLISAYIFASWWAWWFGGAFGHRCFIEYYSLLSLPLAGFINEATKSKKLRVPFFILIALMIYYSLGLTFLYKPPWDGPEWTYKSLWLQIEKLIPFYESH
jgi:hypothetical protein